MYTRLRWCSVSQGVMQCHLHSLFLLGVILNDMCKKKHVYCAGYNYLANLAIRSWNPVLQSTEIGNLGTLWVYKGSAILFYLCGKINMLLYE